MSNGLGTPNVGDIMNPLSSEQLDELRDSLANIALAREAVERMRQAGIDVKDQLQRLDESEQQARALLSVYDK